MLPCLISNTDLLVAIYGSIRRIPNLPKCDGPNQEEKASSKIFDFFLFKKSYHILVKGSVKVI